MKESKLIEMRNNIETLGAVCQKITQELQMLKVMVMGDHQVIKRLSEFESIVEQLKQEQNEQETESDRVVGADSGTADTDQ